MVEMSEMRTSSYFDLIFRAKRLSFFYAAFLSRFLPSHFFSLSHLRLRVSFSLLSDTNVVIGLDFKLLWRRHQIGGGPKWEGQRGVRKDSRMRKKRGGERGDLLTVANKVGFIKLISTNTM